KALREREYVFELIIVENGSTDGTLSVAHELESQYDEVRVEHRDEADYGEALRTGLLGARGDVVVNFDTDYYDVDFLDAAVARVARHAPMTVSCGARVLASGLGDGPGWVQVEDGHVVATGAGRRRDAHDVGTGWLAPGYIDIQVNGMGATDFATATVGDAIALV